MKFERRLKQLEEQLRAQRATQRGPKVSEEMYNRSLDALEDCLIGMGAPESAALLAEWRGQNNEPQAPPYQT